MDCYLRCGNRVSLRRGLSSRPETRFDLVRRRKRISARSSHWSTYSGLGQPTSFPCAFGLTGLARSCHSNAEHVGRSGDIPTLCPRRPDPLWESDFRPASNRCGVLQQAIDVRDCRLPRSHVETLRDVDLVAYVQPCGAQSAGRLVRKHTLLANFHCDLNGYDWLCRWRTTIRPLRSHIHEPPA